MSNEVKCPRDGNIMVLVLESEKLSDGTVKAYFSYKCVVCGFKQELERVEVARSGDVINIKRTITPPG